MAEEPRPKYSNRISRRNFVGALGAAAAAGVFLERGQSQSPGTSQVYYYLDSFGNVVPAGQGALDLGIYPPPIPAALAPSDAANPETCGNGTDETRQPITPAATQSTTSYSSWSTRCGTRPFGCLPVTTGSPRTRISCRT